MGDVAMMVPVILALKNQNPQVEITVVSRPFYKPIFQNIPNINFFSVHTHHQYKGIFGIYKLYQKLKSKKIDQFVDLHNVIRSKIIRFLFFLNNKKTISINKGRREKKKLTRSKNKFFNPLKHNVERYSDVFKKLGYTIDLSSPMTLGKEKLSTQLTQILGEKSSSSSTKWIGIAPFAQHSSKVYPLDLMQIVINQLAQNKNFKIILFGGGKQESEILEKMAQNIDNVFNFAQKFNFEDELNIISNLDVMLSMDSGNAHLAAIYGVKTITLWGSTHPHAGFSPYNQPIENCLTADRKKYPKLPTSIYGNKKVKGYENVMRTISPEKIVLKIQSQIID